MSSTTKLNYVKYIYDNIHGNIGVTETELKIIDTKVFQRLHRIKQLGPANMVYPGATHSRFAHSLGAMFVMEQYLQQVKHDGAPIADSEDERQKLRLAALLHDVGHYPFSHSLEAPIEKKFGGHDHEKHGINIIKNILKDNLDTYKPKEITDIIEKTVPNSIYSTLISSEMDVDKTDYLQRDSYHTGVGYGNIDVARLLRTLSFDKDANILFEKSGPVIENFLLGRYHMFQVVYTHKVVIALELMIEKIYALLVEQKEIIHPSEILKADDEITLSMFDDDYLWNSMFSHYKKKQSGYLSDLINNVLKREPLKLSVREASTVVDDNIPDGWKKILLLDQDPSKKQILAQNAGSIDPEWIFIYIQQKPTSVIPDDIPIYVKTDNGVIPLNKDDTLVIHKLVNLHFYDSRIYTKSNYADKVSNAFSKI